MRFLSNAQRIGLLGALLIAGSSQADHTPEVALAELKIASLSSRVIGVAPKTATVKIQGKQLTKRHSRLGCSAFVYSDRPDRNHKDNFKPHI